jgi:hypothetical protein
MLYAWSFYLLIFFRFPKPIHLEDLSIISQYRYLVLFVVFCIFIIIYLIAYFFNNQFPLNISFFTYPYLKEEIRVILYTWNDSFFSPICSKIIEHFYLSNYICRNFYFVIYFVIFYGPRIISTLLLGHFIFLGGDLRYVIYCLPILFIIWLLSFIDYYFHIFFQGTCVYIRSLLYVKAKTAKTFHKNIVTASLNDMDFELTEYAIKSEGFDYAGLPALIETWDQCAQLSAYFAIYKRFLMIINYILLCLQFICWFGVVYIFFLKSFVNDFIATGMLFNFFRKAPTQLIVPPNPYAATGRRFYEASHVKQKYRKLIESHTNGVQQGSHPAITDRTERNPENPNEIRYWGQATHGSGTSENPSQELHPIKDLQGKSKPQYHIPVKGRHFYEENWFGPDIPGSKQFLESDPALANIIKHKAQPEDT